MKREVLSIIAAVTICGIALLSVLTFVFKTDSVTRFEKYQQYAEQVNVVEWDISEDTAKSFADSNCEPLSKGRMPALLFRNGEHVKSTGAVIAAYCPESFYNYLAGIAMDYPEYIETAKYLNDRIKIN